MIQWISLWQQVQEAAKTNWTAADYIKFNDFNRIERKTEQVAAYLTSIQYTIPPLTTVTNRTKTYIDFISSINRIEANLEAIRTRFLTPAGYLPAKTWAVGDGFDYTDANRLEANLQLLMEFGVLAFRNFSYCGTLYCGEEGVIW